MAFFEILVFGRSVVFHNKKLPTVDIVHTIYGEKFEPAKFLLDPYT